MLKIILPSDFSWLNFVKNTLLILWFRFSGHILKKNTKKKQNKGKCRCSFKNSEMLKSCEKELFIELYAYTFLSYECIFTTSVVIILNLFTPEPSQLLCTNPSRHHTSSALKTVTLNILKVMRLHTWFWTWVRSIYMGKRTVASVIDVSADQQNQTSFKKLISHGILTYISLFNHTGG